MKKIGSPLIIFLFVALLFGGCTSLETQPTAEDKFSALSVETKEAAVKPPPVQKIPAPTSRSTGTETPNVDGLVGTYAISDNTGKIYPYTHRYIFSKSDGQLHVRGVAWQNPLGGRTYITIENLQLEGSTLKFNIRIEGGGYWSLTECTVRLTGDFDKIPTTTKQIDGNVGKIGITTPGLMVRVGH